MTEEHAAGVVNTSKDVTVKELILIVKEWISYLFSKWLIILICGILGGILGFTYAYLKAPIYNATTTFVLEESTPSGAMGNLGGLASMAGIDLGGGGGGLFQGDNILELYKSRTMIEKTLLTEVDVEGRKELLINRYITFNKLTDKKTAQPLLKTVNFDSYQARVSDEPKSDRLRDSIIGIIAEDIKKTYLNVSKPDKKLSIIKAEVRSEDEFFAKNFNDQIVKNVNDFYVQTKIKKSLNNITILQAKTDSVRGVMNKSINSAAAVSDATPNLNPTRQAQRTAPMQRSQFSVETNQAVLGELLKNLELSKMTLLKEAPLIQVVDQPKYPLKVDKLGKIKGLVFGGIIMGFLTVSFLLVRRLYKKILV